MLRALALLLAFVALASPAAARLCSDSGHVTHIGPPADVRQGALESNDNVFVFPEKSLHLLTSSITVNAVGAGEYALSDLGTPSIAPGVEIDSDYIHFDKQNGVYRKGYATLTFCMPIIGVVGKQSDLNSGHSLLGSPGTNYPSSTDNEGIEGEFDGFEIFAISGDPAGEYRGLKVWFKVADGVDSLRVITRNPGAPIAGT